MMHPLERLRSDFDTLFDRFFGRLPMPLEEEVGEMRVWDFDVSENDKEVTVRAEMPGFEEKEINVELHNDVLTIKAEKEEKEEGGRSFRSFFRTVTLPAGVDAEKAQASYRNGVLELHIPRSEEVKPRRIQVQGGGAAGKPEVTSQATPTPQATETKSQGKK
jgi:HSP20 family protein